MLNSIFHYASALKLRGELFKEIEFATKKNQKVPSNVSKDIWRAPHDIEVFIWLLRYFNTSEKTLLVDIGGNSGYWAEKFMDFFPNLAIVAFEPVSEMFNQYKSRFENKDLINLSVNNVALSNSHGNSEINVAKGYGLTSFLEYNTENNTRNLEFTSKQKVEIHTLDDYYTVIKQPNTNKIAKIDVQGFELNVLKGASNVLPLLDALIIECSFLNEFSNEKPTFPYLTSILIEHGFYPIMFGVFDAKKSPVGWERDVLFVKESLLNKSWGR